MPELGKRQKKALGYCRLVYRLHDMGWTKTGKLQNIDFLSTKHIMDENNSYSRILTLYIEHFEQFRTVLDFQAKLSLRGPPGLFEAILLFHQNH